MPNQYSDPQPYQDKDTLKELYKNRKKTAKEIADHFGVSQATITRWINRHDIKTRTAAESREIRGTHHRPVKDGPHTNEEWLRECYHEKKMTLSEMADEAGLESEVSIMEWMDRFGIERRKPHVTMVHRNPGAGFVHADARGYEMIKHSVGNTTKQFPIHRLLAIAKYGYNEVKDEHIHHKNGVKWDNRHDNIMLVKNNTEHAKYHKGEWANVRENRERDEETGRFIG